MFKGHMRKRLLAFLIAFSLPLSASAAAVYTLSLAGYPVVINGIEVHALTFNRNGLTYLPLRTVARELHIPIEWTGNKVVINTVDTEKLKECCVMIKTRTGLVYKQASGVLIDYDEILTCYHVIKGQKNIGASFDDKHPVGIEHLSDMAELADAAVLNVETERDPAKIGSSSEVKLGDSIFIVSCPNGEENTVTRGEVTGTKTFEGIEDFVVTAKASPGSSGGGCFNLQGELIGIVAGGTTDGAKTYIIPINLIRKSLTE